MTLDELLRNPEFRAALQRVFDAPGEDEWFGPAKGYYRDDVGHFLDLLRRELADSAAWHWTVA